MAGALPTEIDRERPVMGAAGKRLLEAITTGMYDDPLMSIREYIQNATDAIDTAVADGFLAPGEERISVSISGRNRTITVEDNGCGVPEARVERALCDPGYSEKQSCTHRGFRGIGRLGGLAYCKRLIFTTRASPKEVVTEVEWNGSDLRRVVDDKNDSADLASAIAALAVIRTRKATPCESHRFFRVTMKDVFRFYDDSILNVRAIQSYLSSVAPVPYDEDGFSFSDSVKDHFAGMPGWRSYRIYVNGRQLFKHYRDEVRLSETKSDRIAGVEAFEIRGIDGGLVGRGWYALTGLLGAIPRTEPVRGIRARQGNIAFGDERFFEKAFIEPRFALWHMGEVELSHNVRPNARRDGFEQTASYERLLAHMAILGRELSSRCRTSSSLRSQERTLSSILNEVERLISSYPMFIDNDHATSVANKASVLLGKARPAAMDGMKEKDVGKRYLALSRMLRAVQKRPPLISDCIDERLLGEGCTKRFLEDLCRRIFDTLGPDGTPASVLSCILMPYLKEGVEMALSSRKNGHGHEGEHFS